MRFSSVALWMALAAPAAKAFSPLSLREGHPSSVHEHPQQRAAFVVRQRDHNDRTFLSSVAPKKGDIDYATIRDSLAALDLTEGVEDSKRAGKDVQVDPQMAQVAAIETRANTASYLSQYEGETGASIVYTKLVEHGVTLVNGFSGGAVLPLLDQFHENHPRHAKAGKAPIQWITNSNEASSGYIAEGYAKTLPLDGKHKPVGVVVATSGPGVTNLITPMQDAMSDGVPLLVLCGQAATVAPPDAFQSSAAVDLSRPCTKWSYQIKSAAEVPLVMDYAFFMARNGRPGPVFIDLPKDLLGQMLTTDLIDSFIKTNLMDSAPEDSFVKLAQKIRPSGEVFQALMVGTDGKTLPFEVTQSNSQHKVIPVGNANLHEKYHADHHPTNKIIKHGTGVNGSAKDTQEGDLAAGSPMLEDLIELIRVAKKPVLIAGQGANDSPEELKAFAEKFQIPTTTTLHGMGVFDERHPLALNMLGMHGHPTPNFMIQESDLVISIGSRFDDRITGRMGGFVPEARKAAEEGRGGIVHVDIRLTENAKQIKPTFFVHSTAKNFLQTMNSALDKLDIQPNTGAWRERMRELQKEFPVKIPRFPTNTFEVTDEIGKTVTMSKTKMSAQYVIEEMNRQLVEANTIENTIFTTGVGVHQMVAAQLITWTTPRQMVSSGSLGTMGVALGYCIGAKLANENKMCIAVDGDGSFNMTFTELKTLMEQKIPVKIMILDNEGQMMVEYWQRLFHQNRLIAIRNTNPDYVALAQAFNVKALRCDCEEDLAEKMKDFLFSDPDEPVVFHVKVERTPCLPLVAPGQPLDDMILEDVAVDVDGMAAPS